MDVDRFLTSANVLRNDSATASIYGDIRAALADAGTMIPANDIGIAASAVRHELPRVIGDAHFANVPGLTVESW